MRLPTKYTHKGYSYLEWAEAQKAYHCGTDFNYGPRSNSDLGLPLYPFKSGKVVHTSEPIDPTTSGYGKIVILKHNDDEYSKYAHLDEIKCKIGDKVTTFDEIATIGKSGTSSPHLHFEIFDKHIKDLGFAQAKGYRYYPSYKSKEFVKEHYKNPLEHIRPTTLKVHIVADGVSWIDEHIEWVQDWFMENTKDQLFLDIEVEHVEVATKLNENDKVDLAWFFDKFRDDFAYKDIAIYCTSNEDWENKDFGGYQKGGKQLGLETIFMHAEPNGTRSFATIEHEFRGRITHEIIHSLYEMTGKNDEDRTHYWDYDKKQISEALKEIDYDNLKVNPLTKTYMFKLVKGSNDEDVFAIGVNGKKHHIVNEYTYKKGVEQEMWKDDFEEWSQKEVDNLETGFAFVASPNK